jgi:hypothetical protein
MEYERIEGRGKEWSVLWKAVIGRLWFSKLG